MRAGEDERRARLSLMSLSEPNDVSLARLVRKVGAVETLSRVTSAPDVGAPGRDPTLGRRDYGARPPVPDAAAVLDRAAARGMRLVVPGDLEWPSQLDDLWLPGGGQHRAACPPLGLWVRGTAHLRRTVLRSVAVVGSRAATSYGSHVAADLAAGLADRGWAVVSGAAYGIDAAAHRGSLAGGGATVAVLASGADVPYPRAHTALVDRVADEGAVVSELPLGESPTRSRFLDRNRLIAALTPATVVVEAAFRSGALNTVAWARRLGRHVLAVPGPVTSALSAGPHREVRDHDARLVTSAGEVVAEVGSMTDALAEVAVAHQRDAERRTRAGRPHDGLSATTRLVLDALDVHEPRPLEDVSRRAGLVVSAVRGSLDELVRAGLATADSGGWRARHPRGSGRAAGRPAGDAPVRGP
jgi:DNA processing protein